MKRSILIIAAIVVLGGAISVVADDSSSHDEAALKQQYDAFVQSLDHRLWAQDYAGAIRNVDSSDRQTCIVGINTLAATEEPAAIPWLVPLLDAEDAGVRIMAGQGLNRVVAQYELRRRDKTQPEKVVILPHGPDDVDLRPVSWVILKMLKMPDDGNTHAFAANMIAYLGLSEYEAELESLLESRHPAVKNAAQRALEMIEGNPRDGGRSFEELTAKLKELGVRITTDPRTINAATSEAAYFMFADRKDHQPTVEPLTLPLDENWPKDKRIYSRGIKKEIFPLLNQLVGQMGYNQVYVYHADVHYGVSSYANFTLYKLSYKKDDPRSGKQSEVLLGDAEYVLNLP